MRRKIITLILITLFLLIPCCYAIYENKPIDHRESVFPSKNFRLLDPIAELLSGPVWLHIRGFKIYERSPEMSSLTPSQGGLPIKIPYRNPSPKFSRNLLISRDVGQIPYQAETGIAVNPKNPDNIVIGMNDYGFYSPSAYVSMDGGVTWDGPHPMSPLQRDDYGSDVSLAFDRNGSVYFAYMSIGWKWVKAMNVIFGDEKASIVISKSEDGGRSWSPPITVSTGDIYVLEDKIVVKFLDRPRITVGPDPYDLDKDRIYVTYTEFVLRYPLAPQYPYVMAPMISTTIKLVYSVDGGRTWSTPKSVSPTFSYWTGEEGRIVQGSNPKVAGDGKLYVAYYDSLDDGPWNGLFSPTIVWSNDGGESFSTPIHVDYLLEMDYELPPTFFRAWVSMMPQIAIGPNGEIYLTVAAKPKKFGADDSDIFFYKSPDGGETWSDPKRLNDDETTRDQFMPMIAVSPNGTINVAWADRRLDPKDVEYHIYYARSSDGGESWSPNIRVTDAPSNPNHGLPYYIGDYFSMAAVDDDVYVAWTDTRLGRIGSPNMKISFARLKQVPPPSISISPSSGIAGQEITLIGENFIPDGEVFIMIGDSYASTIRTDDDGRFKAEIFMPMLREGKYRITAIDISGNNASQLFYAEFGVDTMKKEFKESRKNYEDILGELRKLKDETESILRAANMSFHQELQQKIMKLQQELRDLAQLTYILTILLVASISSTIILLIKLRKSKRQSSE